MFIAVFTRPHHMSQPQTDGSSSRHPIFNIHFNIILPYLAGSSGRSHADIVDSNPTRGHGYLSVVSVVGRGLCDELITRPRESYRLWCVVVCDLETSWMRRTRPTEGLLRPKKNKAPICLGRFLSNYFGFHLSVSFRQRSTRFYPLVCHRFYIK